jgi:glycogen operon protein
MSDLSLDFELPELGGRRWSRVVDTAQLSPSDIAEPGAESPVTQPNYRAEGRSVVVLVSQPLTETLRKSRKGRR